MRRSYAGEGAILLAALALSLPGAFGPGHPDNMRQYAEWARVAATEGVAAVYRRDEPVYPPVLLYAYAGVGHVYRHAVDPTFERSRSLRSEWLRTSLKLVGVGFHLLLAIALFLLVSRLASQRAGLAASAAYALSPGAIYDVAYFGQPDSAHGLFAVCALGLLALKRISAAGSSLGLALMTKPQAWAIVPAVAAGAARAGRHTASRVAALAAVTGVVTLLPLLAAGQLGDIASLPGRLAAAMPVVTAEAHNVWWIPTLRWSDPYVRADSPLVGPLTYQHLAVVLLLALAAFVAWRVWRAGPSAVPLGAAYVAFAWFMLTTHAHANHAYLALPLLALVLHATPVHWILFAGLSTTVFANVFLHDPNRWELVTSAIGEDGHWLLTQANAAANLGLLACWTWLFVRQTRRGPSVNRAEWAEAPATR